MDKYLVLAINYNKHQYELLQTQLIALNLDGKRCKNCDIFNNINQQSLTQNIEQILKDTNTQQLNRPIIILIDKYICLNKDLVNILNNNIGSECLNYKLGNNWIIMPELNNDIHNIKFKELNNFREITRENYNEIKKITTNKLIQDKIIIYYNSGQNPRDIVLFERYVHHVYPIIPQKYTLWKGRGASRHTNDFKFSNNLEINIFLDKKVGFQEELFSYMLEIDFGSNGENIELNVYNGFTNYLWIKEFIEDKISHSKISKCKLNFINFKKLNENIDIQSKENRIISYKKFYNSNNDY